MADAVVDPWTMVVQFKDVEVTLLAVVGSERFPSFLRTLDLLTGLHFKQLALELSFESFRDATRVWKACFQVADHCHKAQAIEYEEVDEAAPFKGNTLNELVVDEIGLIPVEDASPITDILTIPNEQQYLQQQS